MNWQGFAAVAPGLAAMGEERFERTGLALVGTLRKDGWPRISPVEPYIVDGELMLGMMWRSRKALDLLRDPRVVVHSTTCNREGTYHLFSVNIESAAFVVFGQERFGIRWNPTRGIERWTIWDE